ncbi:hypothetical protein LCGC14_1275070 [marine sediment metagenome]|uniref:Uncharacterized protein n=1 Tax=marine sediment metagenome TaxID=412755 RepID=A0A0F9LI75_9ZZZZ
MRDVEVRSSAGGVEEELPKGYRVTKELLEGDWKLPLVWQVAAEEVANQLEHYTVRSSAI